MVARERSLTLELQSAALLPWPVASLTMSLCARTEVVTAEKVFRGLQPLLFSLAAVCQSRCLFKPARFLLREFIVAAPHFLI